MSSTALCFDDVTIVRGNREILSHLSFAIDPGEFVLLLGSNGTGKSTLIRSIMGEITPSQGKIHKGSVGLIAQDPRDSTYDTLTIRENCRLRTRKECREHLARFLPKLAKMMDHPVSFLSGGERQVLALALCLLDPPDLLLLDEHTSALDPKTAQRVMEVTLKAVKEHHITTVMTTHNLEQVTMLNSRILALRNGKLALDGKVSSKEEVLQLCYE